MRDALVQIAIVILLINGLMFVKATTAAPLAQKQKIVLAAGDDFEPYYSKNLRNGGIAVEIVRQAFLRVGYELEVKWVPWPRALKNAKKGSYDGVLGAWFTQERTKFFTYSQPFFNCDIVLFKRKGDSIAYSSLKDLKRYRIGVALDSAPHEFLLPEFAENIETARTGELNIRKLMGKRLDLMAEEKLSIVYLLNTQHSGWRDAVEILEPPLQSNQFHVIISKKVARHRMIVDEFNLGLRKITEEGMIDKLQILYTLQTPSKN